VGGGGQGKVGEKPGKELEMRVIEVIKRGRARARTFDEHMQGIHRQNK
jgi:hypothetical protein